MDFTRREYLSIIGLAASVACSGIPTKSRATMTERDRFGG